MTTAACIARKAAVYIRKNGFSQRYVEYKSFGRDVNGEPCGCFIHAIETVLEMTPMYDAVPVQESGLYKTLIDVVGCRLGAQDLADHGWTRGADKDAAAALDIVADLLS
jgi:hypothetical protein